MSFRRLILFEPSLRDRHGHAYVYTREIALAARRAGLSTLAYVGNRCGPDILDELQALPVFHHDLWAVCRTKPGYGLVGRWMGRNEACETEMRRLGDLTLDGDDLLIWPTVSEYNAFGLSQWYRDLAEPRPKICVLFHEPASTRFDKGEDDLSAALFRRSLTAWAEMPVRDVLIGATNPSLAEKIARWLPHPVVVLPHVVKIDDLAPRTHRRSQPLTLLYAGHNRVEKGIDLISHLLYERKPDLKSFRFIMHIQIDAADPFWKDAVPNFDDNVAVVKGVLDRRRYRSLLMASDAVLLFYDPANYRDRVSGVLTEALASGLPVITTRGTSMAEEVELAGMPGVIVDEWSADALLAAITSLPESWNSCKAAALRAATDLRRDAGRDFFHAVLSYFAPGTRGSESMRLT